MTIIMYPTAARLTLTIIEKVKSSGLRLITLIGAAPAAPETRLQQHGIQRGLCAGNGALERTKKPRQPARNIERALLGAFEHGAVILALTLDLCRQAVEALRTAVGARQKK